MVSLAIKKGGMGEVQNDGGGGADALVVKLDALETALTGKYAALEAKLGEVQNSADSAGGLKLEVEALKTTLDETKAALAGIQEVQNAGPVDEREAVLRGLLAMYVGGKIEEVQNAAPEGFLREDKIKEVIAWEPEAGFDLMEVAYKRPTTDTTADIGVALRTGARRSKAAAREWSAGAVTLKLTEIRDYVSVKLSDRTGSDFNIVGEIAKEFFDNKQISLADEFLWGQKVGRPDAALECKGVLVYAETTTDEADKLRVISAGAAGAATDAQLETALVTAWGRLPERLRSRAEVTCNATLATRLRAMKYTTDVSKVDADGRFLGLLKIRENSNADDVGADKFPFVVYVAGRAYGVGYQEKINAGVTVDQGDESFWTVQMFTGGIGDFASIYAVKVPA